MLGLVNPFVAALAIGLVLWVVTHFVNKAADVEDAELDPSELEE